MLSIFAEDLKDSVRKEIDHFCNFAFAQTRFLNTFINFSLFDPTHVCKALTDVRDNSIFVNYNVNSEDDIYKILEVLAHESIHAKQLSEQRLGYILLPVQGKFEWGWSWEGTPFYAPKTAEEVIRLPWEIEAFAGTEGVLAMYGALQSSKGFILA